MHYRNLFTSLLVLSSGYAVFADEIDDALGDAASTASTSTASTSSVALPSFTPISIPAPFFEQFTKDWNKRWVPSKAKKDVGKDAKEEWAYVGRWAVEEPSVLKGVEGDEGLVVKDPAAHHAISAKFEKPLDNTGKTLVVQYEVKLQNGLECGGAYLKLLKDNKALHAEEFSNASPYVIMFGPDKCGATNKVHFIFKHKDPKTGEYEEKHLNAPPMVKTTKQTTLYTLIVKPDQTYEIRIDGKEAKKGSLFEDFNPPVNPPKMIDDPNDKKPADWVDQAMIPDPKAKKPDDWDEDAPYEITDEKATKPEDWLEDEPVQIPDPEAKKPEDWDDDEDGDWIAPSVPNPKCAEISGCGPWEKPKIANPDYKGKWTAPLIDNPDYKGVWAPRLIENPKYSEDKTPANLEPIGAVGFELWTMQKDILFDNIYIGHSIEDAEKIQKETFDIKKKSEQALDTTPEPVKHEDEERETYANIKEEPLKYIRQRLEIFFAIAKRDPVTAFRLHPDVAGSLFVVVGTLFALLFGLFSSAPKPVKKAPAAIKEKKKTVEKKLQEEASEISAASASESESKPRTTRRSSKKT